MPDKKSKQLLITGNKAEDFMFGKEPWKESDGYWFMRNIKFMKVYIVSVTLKNGKLLQQGYLWEKEAREGAINLLKSKAFKIDSITISNCPIYTNCKDNYKHIIKGESSESKN